MKFIYSLAALAVAGTAVTLSVFADGEATAPEVTAPVNLVAGWDNNGNPNYGDKTAVDFGWVILKEDGTVSTTSIGKYDAGGTTRFQSSCCGRPNGLFMHFQNSGAAHFAYPISNLKANTTYVVSFDFCKNGNDGNNKEFILGVNSKADNTGTSYYNQRHYTSTQNTWINSQCIFTTGETVDEPVYVTFNKINNNGVTQHLPLTNFAVYELDLASATAEKPVEVTGYIFNPSFEQGTEASKSNVLRGWTNVGAMEKQNNTSFPGKSGLYYVEKWCSATNNGHLTGERSVKQTVKLNKGAYKLTANSQNLQQDHPDAEKTGAWIVAGDSKTEVKGADTYEVLFDVMADETSVELGFYAKDPSGNYITVDDFHLYYLGVPNVNDAYVKLRAEVLAYLMDEMNGNYGGAFEMFTMTELGQEIAEIAMSEDMPADVEAAYDKLADLYAQAKTAIPSFHALYDAKQLGYEIYAGAEAASDETLASLSKKLQAEIATAEEAKTAADEIKTAYRAVAEGNAVAEGWTAEAVELGTDWTTEAAEGYDVLNYNASKSGEGATLANGERLQPYWDGYKSGAKWGTDFYQNVTLPAGHYRLSVFARAAADSFSTYELYAGDASVALDQIGSDEFSNVFGYGWNVSHVDFTVYEEQEVKLGVLAVTDGGGKWASFANFQLVRVPVETAVVKKDGEEITTDNIKAEKEVEITFEYGDDVEVWYKWTPDTEVELFAVTDEAGYTLHNSGEPVKLSENGTLEYYTVHRGFKSAVKSVRADISTAVSEIGVEAGEAEYYTLDGVKVAKEGLEKGIYVVRQGGKTFKAVVK